MTGQRRVAAAAAAVIGALLLLGSAVVAVSQDPTQDQQTRERCENNRRRLAELERLKAIVNERIEKIWTPEKETATRDTLNEVRRWKANKEYAAVDVPPPCADASIELGVRAYFSFCLRNIAAASHQDNVPPDVAAANRKKCLDALETALGRAIQDAVRQREQKPDMQRQIAELDQQIRHHQVNLSALRCEALEGAFSLTGTWSLDRGTDTGWIWLTQTGTSLTGKLSWMNHVGMATIMRGTFAGGRLEFLVLYADGEEVTYEATLDGSGEQLSGRLKSTTTGSGLWTATRNR